MQCARCVQTFDCVCEGGCRFELQAPSLVQLAHGVWSDWSVWDALLQVEACIFACLLADFELGKHAMLSSLGA
jgi:hypothetical protein